MSQDHQKLMQIFFPFATERQEKVRNGGMRFVHYTSAEAATNILRSKEVRLGQSSCMNDFMEVQHGLNCVSAAYNNAEGKLKRALESVFDGASADIETLFNGWMPHFRTDTYLTCFSEHDDAEDACGRLSMWGAYGGTTGVALVVNSAPFLLPSDALKAYASPVAYLGDKAFEGELAKVAEAIEANADFLRSQGRDTFASAAFNMLRFACLCTKHPGFEEEREWRVVYGPALASSAHIVGDIKVINGTPQPIFKIPLKDIPDEGLVGVEIPMLLDRIIIGPTKYPLAIWKAFVALLVEAGVKEPEKKVHVSDIPLRV
jgi:Protein of unknown function (DUF2971)